MIRYLIIASLLSYVPTHIALQKPPAQNAILTEKAKTAMQSEGFRNLRQPVLFSVDTQRFVYAETEPEGSGGFTYASIFWIAPDQSLQPVHFESAADVLEQSVDVDEYILGGGSPVQFENGKLSFQFDVARNGDARCCPTAGTIQGTYKVQGTATGFSIVVDEFRRIE